VDASTPSPVPPTPVFPSARFIFLGGALAWAGVLICLLLISASQGGRFSFCMHRLDCETVLTSRYAALLGIPLPWLGLAFYSALLALMLSCLATRSSVWRARILSVALWLGVAGVSFSTGLIYVQFWVLHAFCGLCIGSAVVLTALVLVLAKAARTTTADFRGSPQLALALALLAVLTAAALHFSLERVRRTPVVIDLTMAEISGPRDAKVQLVVFSDFTCKYCIELEGVLRRIRQEFPHDVMVAYRAFPLDIDGRGNAAAIAAKCASEQGAFWEYHDRLFAAKGDLAEARLLAIAQEMSLDQERFRQCLRSEPARKWVEDSGQDAERLGVKGAPTLFLNGQVIGGMVGHENLEHQIRARLKTK
jgi:protein-disulfide isomerase